VHRNDGRSSGDRRDGPDGDTDPDTNAHPDPEADAQTNTEADAHPDSEANTEADPQTDSEANTEADPGGHEGTDPHREADGTAEGHRGACCRTVGDVRSNRRPDRDG
jgi:hypothetical protein